MRLLFVGDVIGKPGRRALKKELLKLIDRERIDFTVVNVENIAGGFGITPATLDDISELPIDCMTTGNHVWDKKEGVALLDQRPDRRVDLCNCEPHGAEDTGGPSGGAPTSRTRSSERPAKTSTGTRRGRSTRAWRRPPPRR